MVANKKVLKHTDKGREVAVQRPSTKQIQDAQNVHTRAFREALENKAILKESLEKHMREQGLWDDSRQAELDKLTKTLWDGEKALKRGKIKLSEAKKIAFDMQDARTQMVNLLAERRNLEAFTAQGMAENVRFNYFVSVCTVYNDTGKPVFTSVENYRERSTEDFAWEAASTLAEMLHAYDPETEKKLPENAFLIKYKMADEKMRLINADGKLVDRDGRLVDEEGRFINEQGELVDRDGNRVDAEGNYIIEDAGAFLDEDGNPLQEEPVMSAE